MNYGFVAAPACRWARSNASSGRERSSADIGKASFATTDKIVVAPA